MMKIRLIAIVFFVFINSLYSIPLEKTTFMVPMRDSVNLATDVYKLNTGLVNPVILYRTPYNKDTDGFDTNTINLLNIFGYVYVSQDCRGRFHSEGIDSVFINDGWGELQDGYDTIDWISKQSWCNGKVAMLGGSATGITTLRAVGAMHPNLVCAAVVVAPSDFYHQVVYPGGEFRKSLNENWIHEQGSDYMADYFLEFPYYNHLWEEMDLHTRTSQITIPILHIGGWYDCFSDGTIDAFLDLSTQPNAGLQKLVMGPWVHGEPTTRKVGELTYPNAGYDWESLLLQWLNCWMRNIPGTIPTDLAVTYYLMGDPDSATGPGCEWIKTDIWPPENAVYNSYYFASNRSLSQVPPDSAQISFQFGPNNPVPTQGGNNLTIDNGPYDQRAIGERDDIIKFSTGPLAEPIRLEGFARAFLTVSSNRPDTDFTVKLVDVYPDGREMLVTDGIQRARFRGGYLEEDEKLLVPGEPAFLAVNLPPTAIVFNAGHSIQVEISSSNFPRFEVNPNTAKTPNDRSEKQVAENTVFTGGILASYIDLPLVPVQTSVESRNATAIDYDLLRNYPNPFNSGTIIQYQQTAPGRVEIAIFDILGQRIRVLEKSFHGAGSYELKWDGRNDNGQQMPSGTYICQLKAGDILKTTRMVMLK